MLYLIIAAAIVLAILLYRQNNALVLTTLEIKSEKLSAEFDGFKILHVSDLHNKKYFRDALIKKMRNTCPDMIAVTGDIINTYYMNPDYAVKWCEKSVAIAPTFYVSGNHELRSGIYKPLLTSLENVGVTTLENKSVNIVRGSSHIRLIGIASSHFSPENARTEMVTLLNNLKDDTAYNILLAHQPEKIDLYARTKVDLCLSGHAHGGQIRLPFIGGIIAPGQGFFPKYTSGLHRVDNTSLVISRGLSNSGFPLRIGNRPELVLITLKKA